MTRSEIIAMQKKYGLPEAWIEYATYYRDKESSAAEGHLVEIRTPHVGLTLRGAIDIRISSSGGHISIAYGELMDQVVTLTNERMRVEAGVPR